MWPRMAINPERGCGPNDDGRYGRNPVGVDERGAMTQRSRRAATLDEETLPRWRRAEAGSGDGNP